MSSSANSFRCWTSCTRVAAHSNGSGGCDIATAPKFSGEVELT